MTPTIKGLPKIHKTGIPLRPITSGIGSASHKLAKVLAKPLSSALGNISNSHLQNSTDLIQRLNDINFSQKRLISYDITSLFTNVSIVGAIDAIKEALQSIDESILPIGKRDYMQLIERCMRFGSANSEPLSRGVGEGSFLENSPQRSTLVQGTGLSRGPDIQLLTEGKRHQTTEKPDK
ncbi:uncharacterized protein LOC143018766 [Oratosquilla oratoria]|uniref:uncharacterized protein LOC143018766 n=1 Tax=Oratosquilla oratoria TaxID=337810 RepID=UPI003F7644A2